MLEEKGAQKMCWRNLGKYSRKPRIFCYVIMYEDKPGTYWYILVCTKTNQVHNGMYQYVREISKMIEVQDVGFPTKDLMHTILRVILLCHHGELFSDMGG